jgi:hypothetical protein
MAMAGLSEEGGLSLIRLQKVHFALGPENCYRKSRESSARADIYNAQRAGGKRPSQVKTLAIVQLDGLTNVLNAPQIEFLVPFAKQFVVSVKSVELNLRKRLIRRERRRKQRSEVIGH